MSAREIAALLGEHVATGHFAGLAFRDGDASYGTWLPVETAEEPAFLVQSITKIFTAVVALRLEELGTLSLDTTLDHFRPDVPEASRITLRHLLRHEAGLPDYGPLRAYHRDVRARPEEPWSRQRFEQETFARGLDFAPGNGWRYSNPGFMLIHEVIEQVGGTPWHVAMAELVLRPLGLVRTRAVLTPADLSALAPAPSTLLDPDGEPRDTRDAYHPGWIAHGVLASVPTEIVRFLDAVADGTLLQPGSRARLLELVPVPGDPPGWSRPSYGLGVMADPASPFGLIWGHNGAGPGYQVSAFHAPDLAGRPVTVCALCASEVEDQAEMLVREVFARLARRT